MRQAGFTLIELIMVIVILGILSVIAIPKYVDLQAEAKVAAADGVLGAAASACAINYAAVRSKSVAPDPITTCGLLSQAIVSSGVAITSSGDSECSFTLSGKTFSFAITPETGDAPCAVAKVSGKWPAS